MSNFAIPTEPLLAAAVIFIRISFLFTVMPIFSDAIVSLRIRTTFAFAFTMLIAPMGLVSFPSPPASVAAFVFGLLPEALIGLTLGIIGRIMFAAVQLAGQISGRQMGFSMAREIDPSSGLQITVVAQMQYIMMLLIFLHCGIDGHFYHALVDSFRVMPPFSARVSQSLIELISNSAANLFVTGVRLNFPIIGAMVVINITFAILARAVSGFNVMMESFPVRILAGIALMGAIMPYVAYLFQELFGQLAQDLPTAVRLMTP